MDRFLLLESLEEIKKCTFYSNMPFIQNAMSHQRFGDIKKYLYLCNNDVFDKMDKLAKVKNFLDMI